MRVLVVDDHEVVRRGITAILAAEATLTLCGEAVDGKDAIEKATALRPDIVVMDITMPQMNGLEATREIKRLLPQTEVVIVSQHDAPEMVRQGFKAGARGYVLKSAVARDLVSAIAKVNRKESFVVGVEVSERDSGTDPTQVLERSADFKKALRDSEERFRSAMNNMAEGLVMIDHRGRITYLNPAAEALFGWSSSELLEKDIHAATHYQRPDGSQFPPQECAVLRVVQTGAAIREHEDVFLRKDGSFFPAIVSASPLRMNGEIAGAVFSFSDDSRRRDAQEALRQSERIYRAIGESLDYGVWICDAQGKNIYASSSFLRLVGLTQKECSDLSWAHLLHPDDKDGTLAAWEACVREESFWEREHRFRTADGGWRHILARGVAIRDRRGVIIYWAGINLDIQHRKQAEEQLNQLVQTLESRVSERTEQLEKVTTKLRDLTATLLRTQDEERRRIARELHDGVGQLVVAMSMNLSNVTSEKEKLSPKAREILDQNILLIDEVSREIRTMSHLLHPPLLDEVGLDSALRWYLEGFSERSKIKVHTELVKGFADNLPRDLALSLFRIVQESLTNIHRHAESPSASVKVDRSRTEITLVIQDQGKGIPAEIQSKISSGEIPGVGLRGIRERIHQFGGRLEIRADAGGTTIVAALPLYEIADTREQAEGSQEQLKNTGNASSDSAQAPATILCIDDESSGLMVRRLLLESAGYRVLEANSGPAGIQLFNSETVDVVILDYWMSGMKGIAVAAELKRIKPFVPIIVLSGMADLPGESSGLIDQWLLKGSHRSEQLLDSVAALLERRPT